MKTKPKKLIQSSVCVTMALLTGCASIIDGGPKSVTIRSTPPGAALTIVNVKSGQAVHSGTTPATVVLARSNGFFQSASYTATVEKNGKKQSITITSNVGGWYLGNILFGGLLGILIVDPATGAMWTFSNPDYHIDLGASSSVTDGNRTLSVMTIDQLTSEQRKHLVPLAAKGK